MEQSLRPRWTARNVHIDGHNLVHPSEGCVALTKDTAADTASADGDDHLRLRRRAPGLQQRQLHIPGHRTGDQQHIRVAWRGDEVNAETFQIIDRAIQTDNFNFATIA